MSQAHTSNTLHPLSVEAVEARRALFGGWFMEAEGGTGDSGDSAGSDDEGQAEDEASGDGDTENGEGDDNDDPRVRRANRQAAAARVQLRETQAQLEQLQAQQTENATVLQALRTALTGEDPGTETDPAEALQQITTEAEGLRTEVQQLRAGLLVHELASDHNANPVSLLDSRRFTDTLHGLDPAADDYRDQVAQAIKDAVTKNASLTVAGQGPSRGGAAGAGSGSATPGSVTQEQFNAMSYQERVALRRTNEALYQRLAGTAT